MDDGFKLGGWILLVPLPVVIGIAVLGVGLLAAIDTDDSLWELGMLAVWMILLYVFAAGGPALVLALLGAVILWFAYNLPGAGLISRRNRHE